jgi:hypothetical protein
MDIDEKEKGGKALEDEDLMRRLDEEIGNPTNNIDLI